MSEIKIGDRVRLKSGGPVMTLSSFFTNRQGVQDAASCTWFEGSKLNTDRFTLESLELVPDNEPSEANETLRGVVEGFGIHLNSLIDIHAGVLVLLVQSGLIPKSSVETMISKFEEAAKKDDSIEKQATATIAGRLRKLLLPEDRGSPLDR